MVHLTCAKGERSDREALPYMQESDITKNTDMTTTGIDDTFSSTAVMKSKDK